MSTYLAIVAIVAFVIVTCGVIGFWIRPRKNGMPRLEAKNGMPRLEAAAPASPTLPPEGPSQRQIVPASRALPPDSRREWVAEIEWHQTEAGPRFSAVCATPDVEEAGTTVAESQPLVWPPTSPASVQALTEAAEQVGACLVDAGWTQLPPGSAWYAKRFAWVPSPSLATDDVAAEDERLRLFAPAPPWPAQAERLWRCEISWDAGWTKSRFRVVAYRPRGRRGRPIGTSSALEWQWMGPPDRRSPEHREAVRRLAARLEATGWTPVGWGPRWYSQRFAWPREGPPSELRLT